MVCFGLGVLEINKIHFYIGSYGGIVKPILNGDGYQSCILVYNDDGIIIKNLELTNENTHLDSLGNTKTISGFGGIGKYLGFW